MAIFLPGILPGIDKAWYLNLFLTGPFIVSTKPFFLIDQFLPSLDFLLWFHFVVLISLYDFTS